MAIGVAFVVLASVLLALTLLGVLIWTIYVIITGFGKGRGRGNA